MGLDRILEGGDYTKLAFFYFTPMLAGEASKQKPHGG